MPANSSRSTTSRAQSRSSRLGSIDDIDYSHSNKLVLPKVIPHHDDDAHREDTVARNAKKWSSFFHDSTYLIFGMFSVTRALGDDPDESLSDIDRLVAPIFTRSEKDLYRDWKHDHRRALPSVTDWRAIRATVHSSTQAQATRWEELTEALRALYGTQSITPESCKGWMERNKKHMPLLIASKKVQQARLDAKGGERGSSARRHAHEMIACRLIVHDIGKFRIEMNAALRELNRDTGEREAELVHRLSKLERERPRHVDMAMEMFVDRESYWKKLTSVRMLRVERQSRASRQNAEMELLEKATKVRMEGLETRLRSERRKLRS